MAKIQNKDLFAGDLFDPTIKDVKDLLGVIKELKTSIKGFATDTKSIANDIKKVQDVRTKGLKDLSKAEKDAVKISQEKIKLDKEEARLNQELAKQEQQQKRVQQESLKIQQQEERLQQQKLRTAKQEAQAKEQQRRATERLEKEQRQLNSVYAQESKKLNDLRRQYKDLVLAEGGATKATRKLRTEIQTLDRRLKKVDAEVGQFQRSVGNYKSALTGSLGTIGQFATGVGAITAGVALLGQGIRSAIGIIKNFDQGQANLAAVLGKTKEQVGDLTQQAKDLGSTTAFSATQVSELQTEFAKLGFTSQQIKDATGATLDLAAASGTDLANAAEIAGATLGGFGLGARQTQRVVDVMAKSFSTSALDITKFQESMKIAAPAAKAVGVSVEETTALLGTLANVGISGSNAGTALRGSFIKLNKAGLTLKEGLELVSNSQNKLGTATELVGKNASTAFLALAANRDVTAQLTEEYINAEGAAKKMADTQLNTLEGSTKLLASAWEGLVLSFEDGQGAMGEIATIIIKDLATGLSVLSGNVDAASEKFSFFSLWLTSIKNQFQIMISLFKLITIPWQILIKLAQRLGERFGFISGKGDLMKKALLAIQKIFISLPRHIANFTESVLNVVSKLPDAIILIADVFIDVGKRIISNFALIGQAIKKALIDPKGALEAGKSIGKNFTEGFKEVTETLPKKLQELFDDAKPVQLKAPEMLIEDVNVIDDTDGDDDKKLDDRLKKVQKIKTELAKVEERIAGAPLRGIRTDDLEKAEEAVEKQRKLDEAEEKRREAARKKRLQDFQQLTQGLIDLDKERLQQRLENIDREIAASQKRSDAIRDAAKRGFAAATESLAFEQKKQAELQAQKEREVAKQQLRETILSGVKVYAAKVENDAANPLKSTLTDMTLLLAGLKAVAGFYEGSEKVADDLNPTLNTGRDDYLIRVDGDEKIFKPEHSSRIGYDVSNEEVVQIVERFKRGELAGTSADNLIIAGGFASNQQVLERFDKLQKTLEQLPQAMPRSDFKYDEIERAIITIQSDRTKVVRNHKKQGGIWG